MGPRPLLGLLGSLALVASCSSAQHDGSRSSSALPPGSVRAVHAPSTVGAPRTIAFRRAGAQLTTDAATFTAVVGKSGAIAITPHEDTPVPLAPMRPFELETSRIERGASTFAMGSHVAIDDRGAAVIERGAALERIENDDAALEQSWRFASEPAGEGDLVVRVRVASTHAFGGSTPHGLHFADAGQGVRYGTGTWVDADGKRTEIAPSFERGEIVLRVPHATVSASRYPAVLDPSVTTEKEVDKPTGVGAALGDRSYPLVAASRSSKKGYVAAWYDRRGIRPALYTSRLGANGLPAQDVGTVVANGVNPSTTPFLAAAPGGGYLLVWSVAYYDPFLTPGVYAIRLDDDGIALDKTPITLAENQGYIYSLGAAFDGTSWLVVWQRYSGTTYYDVYGGRLSKDGARLDQTPIEIARSPEYEYNPIVVEGGAGFFVAWRNGTLGLQGRFVSSAGIAAEQTILVHGSASVNEFRVARGQNQFGFAWTEAGNVYAKRVADNGTVLDPAPIGIDLDGNFSESRPKIVWDGTNYVVAFWRPTGAPAILARRMNAAGGVIDPLYQIATGQYLTDASLESDGGGSVLVQREFSSTPNGSSYRYDIRSYATTKPAAAETPTTTGPNLLSKAAAAQMEPAVVWNGTRNLAVWQDQRDALVALYDASLDKEGTATGSKSILQNPNGQATYTQMSRPRIAAAANGFLVVFFAQEQVDQTYRRGIFGLVLDANGDRVGNVRDIAVTPSNAPISIFEREPDVAFDGKSYFVVWQQETNDGSAIAGRRVDPTGAVLDTKESIRLTAVSPAQQRSTPSIAFDGTSYFVSWVTSRPSASIEVTHIYGSRVNKDDLSPLDGEIPICEKFLLQRAPHVSADPKGGFFVVWEDNRNSLETADIYGSRISPQGQVLDGADGIQIATGAHDEARPRAVLSGEGTNWIVAWRDLRSKQTYDVYGAWVSRAGKVHDREGFLLSAEGGDEEAPTLTTPESTKLLLTYQRLDPTAGSYRVRSRVIDSGKLAAAPCATNDECASRSCADGVCCETECGGCGVCNVTPGKCTPRGPGTESPTCKSYKCKEGLECPATCASDADCAVNATCDPATKTCVSRVICLDTHTLKDLTGKTTDCAPYNCVGEACRTNCGSVDDCAPGFVCDLGGQCVRPPSGDDGGCTTSPSIPSGGGLLALGTFLGLAIVRRRRA